MKNLRLFLLVFCLCLLGCGESVEETAVLSPTSTPSATPSPTFTLTPTQTPTVAPSATATSTPTQTPTPTLSPTPTEIPPTPITLSSIVISSTITLADETLPPIEEITFAPNGNWLASYHQEGIVVIWDVIEGLLKHKIEVEEPLRAALAFSPNSQQLAIVSTQIQLWDVISGEQIRSFPSAFSETDIAFWDRDTLVMDGFGFRNVETGEFVDKGFYPGQSHNVWPRSLTFALGPNKTLYEYGCKPRSCSSSLIGKWVYNASDETYSEEIALEGHTTLIEDVVVNRNGRYIASLADDGIIFWDTETGENLYYLEGSFYDMAYFTTVDYLITTDRRSIKIWHATGQRILEVDSPAWQVAVSRDGTMLAYTDLSKIILANVLVD